MEIDIISKTGDEKRYGTRFYPKKVFEQIFGKNYSRRRFSNKELRQLEETINSERSHAKYLYLLRINYTEAYSGEKSLENKLFASSSSNLTNLPAENDDTQDDPYCIEDNTISISVNENGQLVVKNNQTKEVIEKIDANKFTIEVLLNRDRTYNKDHGLDGFTPSALKVIMEKERKKINSRNR